MSSKSHFPSSGVSTRHPVTHLLDGRTPIGKTDMDSFAVLRGGAILAGVNVVDKAGKRLVPPGPARVEAFELWRQARVLEVQARSAALVRAYVKADGRSHPVPEGLGRRKDGPSHDRRSRCLSTRMTAEWLSSLS